MSPRRVFLWGMAGALVALYALHNVKLVEPVKKLVYGLPSA